MGYKAGMRRARNFGALFFVLLFMAGSPSETFGQFISPPDGWVEIPDRPPGIAKYYIAPMESGKFGANLSISHGKSPESGKSVLALDSLIRLIAAQQSRLFPLFKVLDTGKRVINGIEGGYVHSTYARGQLDLENLQFFFYKNGEIYNVVFTTLVSDFKSLRPVLEKSLQSLTLKKGSL